MKLKLRTEKVPLYILVIIGLLSLAFMVIELNVRVRMFASHYQEKKAASELTSQLMSSIREKRLSDGLVIDPINDPNETGMVGLQNSLITTEPGDLTAKLTALNPNFAAVIVQLLEQCGVKKGDAVAVSFTGSFPVLNIAVIAAGEVLGLKPVIIASGGASMWGANDPAFTYLDMERYLYDQGMIRDRTLAGSIGGVDDIGRGLSPEGRDMIIQSLERNQVRVIKAENLEAAVKNRIALYQEYAAGRSLAALVNVGGSAVALAGSEVPSGVIDQVQFSINRGLVGEFLRSGIPVINLDDVNQLAREYEIPRAPIPLPRPGKGRIFYEARYSVFWATFFAAIMFIILFVVLRIDVDHYVKRAITGKGKKEVP
ncbi:MAG TPA: poly-gamma-glutamate system protein [bacterium]